jgi:hypothetical protein
MTHAADADISGAQTIPVDHRDLIMMVTWEFSELFPRSWLAQVRWHVVAHVTQCQGVVIGKTKCR